MKAPLRAEGRFIVDADDFSIADAWADGGVTDQWASTASERAARIAACVNACQGINPEGVPLLVKALDAMMTVQSKRRHPLGAPDEGIAYAAADAMAKAREAMKALGLPS